MTSNYCQKSKENLEKEAPERYQNLSEEEKDKKHQYACEQYINLSEKEKKKKNGQCGRGQYKNLLGDECRKNFLECKNKDYLSIKHFLLYLP